MHRATSARAAGLVILCGVLFGCARIAPPLATFSLSPQSGRSPLVVTFDAAASRDARPPLDVAWDFGDGATATGPHVVHTYTTNAERTFSARLTVTNARGQTATAAADVTVLPSIPAPASLDVRFSWPFHVDAEGDDAAHLNDEYITLENAGDQEVDLSGWTVENERGLAYRFPEGAMLRPRTTLTLHSGAGTNTANIFYWHANEPVWSNTSDIAVLRDAAGSIVDVYGYICC